LDTKATDTEGEAKKLSKPRDRHDIYCEILSFLAITEPALKTEIMQACNLKYSQLDFLETLIKSELVQKVLKEERYILTEKGATYLQKWNELTNGLREPRMPKKRFWRK